MQRNTNFVVNGRRLFALIGVACLFVGMAACSSPSPTQRAADETLQAAQASFASGDYARAIRLLRSDALTDSDRQTQVAAHKLMAFSYCVTGRVSMCRSEFEKALRLDPTFDLSNAEKGHPIWGPAFEAARQHIGS